MNFTDTNSLTDSVFWYYKYNEAKNQTPETLVYSIFIYLAYLYIIYLVHIRGRKNVHLLNFKNQKNG